MTDYNSDLHLSRWRRVVIWFCEDDFGRSIVGLTVIFLLGWPVLLWKWWIAVVLALCIGFVSGYYLARSLWKSEGSVPKL